MKQPASKLYMSDIYIRNRPATEPVMLKICNVKLSFNI